MPRRQQFASTSPRVGTRVLAAIRSRNYGDFRVVWVKLGRAQLSLGCAKHYGKYHLRFHYPPFAGGHHSPLLPAILSHLRNPSAHRSSSASFSHLRLRPISRRLVSHEPDLRALETAYLAKVDRAPDSDQTAKVIGPPARSFR